MNKKKIAISVTALMMIVIVSVGGTLAYFTDREEQNNTVTMGHVDITLEEPIFEKQTNGTLEIGNVVPNQEIIKDPTIIVEEGSLDCYLRVKIMIEELKKPGEEMMPMRDLDILEESLRIYEVNEMGEKVEKTMEEAGWIKGDENYYYYQQSVSAKDVIPVFSGFKIPENWGNEIADMEFVIRISAEAIQADFFTPRYEEETEKLLGWLDGNGEPINAETYSK